MKKVFDLIPTLLMSTFYYFKKIYFLFFLNDMSESVGMYTRGKVPVEAVSVGFLGIGVSGGRELHDMVAGK